MIQICFDATGKIMMTAVNKAKKDGVNQNSSSSLYFWEELNLFDYGLNTRVDNIHGDEIFGIVNLQRNNEKTEGYL